MTFCLLVRCSWPPRHRPRSERLQLLHSDIPSFTASGMADQGVIRLWRKDDEQRSRRCWSASIVLPPDRVPSPLYTYQGDVLRQIKQRRRRRSRFHSTALCRRRHGRLYAAPAGDTPREPLTPRYQNRPVSISGATYPRSQCAARGGSNCCRGVGCRAVQTCDGQRLNQVGCLPPSPGSKNAPTSSSRPVSVAWLEAPEGSELLLVANDDFCS